MKIRSILLAAGALMLSAGLAAAEMSPAQLVTQYQAQGYSWVGVKLSPTTIKVEAIRGTEELEVIYDRATGAILSTETGVAEARYVGRVGSEIRSVKADKAKGWRGIDDQKAERRGRGSDDSVGDDRGGRDRSRADRAEDDDGGKGRGRGRGRGRGGDD